MTAVFSLTGNPGLGQSFDPISVLPTTVSTAGPSVYSGGSLVSSGHPCDMLRVLGLTLVNTTHYFANASFFQSAVNAPAYAINDVLWRGEITTGQSFGVTAISHAPMTRSYAAGSKLYLENSSSRPTVVRCFTISVENQSLEVVSGFISMPQSAAAGKMQQAQFPASAPPVYHVNRLLGIGAMTSLSTHSMQLVIMSELSTFGGVPLGQTQYVDGFALGLPQIKAGGSPLVTVRWTGSFNVTFFCSFQILSE